MYFGDIPDDYNIELEKELHYYITTRRDER
jgi:hypothetical protein